MAVYQQSPGLQVVEKNVSSTTVGLSTTTGAYAGVFQWGPVLQPMLVSGEKSLIETFGAPTNDTFAHYFAAANFLAYANSMYVVRAKTSLMVNASVSGTGVLIENMSKYETSFSAGEGTVGSFAARYPGGMGNGLKVSMADSATFTTWEYASYFTSAPGTSTYAASKGGSNDEMHLVVVDGLGKFSGTVGTILEKYDFVSKARDAVSYQGVNNYYASVLSNRSAYVYWMDHPLTNSNWGSAAANVTFTSLDVVVGTVTSTGATCTGTVATVTFASNPNAFTIGETITVTGFTPVDYNGTYVVSAVTDTSVSFKIASTATAATIQGSITSAIGYDFSYTLSGGVDDNVTVDGDLQLAWDLFKDTQSYDISLVVTGNASLALAKYVVQNIGDVRKDCVVFCSVTASATGLAAPILGSSSTRLADAKLFKDFDSTYAFIDSGYKYMYDKYNDKYRWVAINADVAGLCARVDATDDPWFSPAGATKGQIKGVIKLSWNPTQAERDILYPAGINPVINQVGLGTILFGDKTATTKPSAFDRINVRRLFLVLEKSISNSAKYNLFELNDSITRLQFVASVEPFLRDIQGRRGIQAFKVICDETNNTTQIVQTNQFVGTIMVKPNYSVNFLTLNFVAVGASVSFDVAAGA